MLIVFSVIRESKKVMGLLRFIVSNSDDECMMNCLKAVYSIVVNTELAIHPSIVLASVVQVLPLNVALKAMQHLITPNAEVPYV